MEIGLFLLRGRRLCPPAAEGREGAKTDSGEEVGITGIWKGSCWKRHQSEGKVTSRGRKAAGAVRGPGGPSEEGLGCPGSRGFFQELVPPPPPAVFLFSGETFGGLFPFVYQVKGALGAAGLGTTVVTVIVLRG